MFNKIIGESDGIFNVSTIIEILIGVINVLAGLIFFTSNTNNILASIFAGILIIGSGIGSIYTWSRKGSIDLFNNNVIYGVIIIVIGFVMFFINKYASIVYAIYLLIECAKKVNYSLMLKKYNESSWLITLVTGILFLVMAIITFFTSTDNVILVLGVLMLGFGLLNTLNIILLRKRSRYFLA